MNLFRWIAAAAGLLPLWMGCATKPLVLGLYDVPPSEFPSVREAGFDVVVAKPSSDLMQAALDADLKVLMHTTAFSRPVTQPRLSRELSTYDRHPAAWGWYLVDEPDLHDHPPSQIDAKTREFQRHARKPGVVVVASGLGAKSHGAAADLLLVDFYPIPWSPLARFAKEMRLASIARDDRPFMSVIQAFDWSHFPDVLGQTNGLRAPTIQEIRCMSYMALAMEARGLFYYTYEAGTWRLPESELWPGLKKLAQELRQNESLFREAPLWWPTETAYGDPARMYNEVHESAILARLYHLKKPVRNFSAGHYFVVINTTTQPVRFDFKLPFEAIESVDVLAPTETKLDLEKNWLRRIYDPCEVAIFGPIRARPSFEN